MLLSARTSDISHSCSGLARTCIAQCLFRASRASGGTGGFSALGRCGASLGLMSAAQPFWDSAFLAESFWDS
eukprot:SAG25_NODE_4748_length_756_cov_0.990868_1_plen_71_part_10